MLSQINDTMEYRGFKAQIMEAERLTGDRIHDLPPGRALTVYHADMFEKWPEQWLKSPGVFLVPVSPDRGLWFNWRMNSEINTAVIPTVKGCNPITGLQTTGFHLERYDTKCPKHGCDFLADRFCPECNYKWPDRSYASGSPLWLDGWFNTKDGTVRQFFFSEDELRDIATHKIGKDNTVPAFGFAFYSPKVPRPEPVIQERRNEYILYNNPFLYETLVAPKNITWTYTNTTGDYGDYTSGGIISSGGANNNVSVNLCSSDTSYKYYDALNDIKGHDTSQDIEKGSEVLAERKFSKMRSENVLRSKKVVKEVSVGAGAKIRQSLNHDPYALDTWKDKPDAVMTIYFVFHDKLNELLQGGVRDIEGVKEGMLENLPVG